MPGTGPGSQMSLLQTSRGPFAWKLAGGLERLGRRARPRRWVCPCSRNTRQKPGSEAVHSPVVRQLRHDLAGGQARGLRRVAGGDDPVTLRLGQPVGRGGARGQGGAGPRPPRHPRRSSAAGCGRRGPTRRRPQPGCASAAIASSTRATISLRSGAGVIRPWPASWGALKPMCGHPDASPARACRRWNGAVRRYPGGDADPGDARRDLMAGRGT